MANIFPTRKNFQVVIMADFFPLSEEFHICHNGKQKTILFYHNFPPLTKQPDGIHEFPTVPITNGAQNLTHFIKIHRAKPFEMKG